MGIGTAWAWATSERSNGSRWSSGSNPALVASDADRQLCKTLVLDMAGWIDHEDKSIELS